MLFRTKTARRITAVAYPRNDLFYFFFCGAGQNAKHFASESFEVQCSESVTSCKITTIRRNKKPKSKKNNSLLSKQIRIPYGLRSALKIYTYVVCEIRICSNKSELFYVFGFFYFVINRLRFLTKTQTIRQLFCLVFSVFVYSVFLDVRYSLRYVVV